MHLNSLGHARMRPYLERALRPDTPLPGKLTLIPLASRTLTIGELAFKSVLGPKQYCKAIFLNALATYTAGGRQKKEYVTDMTLSAQISDWLEEIIWDAFVESGRLKTSNEYDQFHRRVHLSIHQGAGYVRRYTNAFDGEFDTLEEIKVAPDFLRGLLLIRTPR